MKNLITIASFFTCMILGTIGNSLCAQNYYSKPQVIKNLSDESKSIYASLPQLSENDQISYERALAKHTVIKDMLYALKKGASVSEAVEINVPSGEQYKTQKVFRLVNPPSGFESSQEWIREEILPLVSY